jgi:hypothetical protein
MESKGRLGQGANAAGSEVPGKAHAAPEAAGRPRPAWVKPVIYQFSLQRTLAGSGLGSDGALVSNESPT